MHLEESERERERERERETGVSLCLSVCSLQLDEIRDERGEESLVLGSRHTAAKVEQF